jgi:signal transduction histidine kinase/CheY-like chemotaxis protein
LQNLISVNNSPGSWSTWVNRIPVAAGAFAVISGVLTLAGWLFKVDRLIDWNDSRITMKANTAVCVILLGIALLALTRQVNNKTAVFIFAGASTLIALLTLSQYVFDVNLGIDTLLFREPPGSPATNAPGRMGFPAITSFTILGVALLFSTGSIWMRRAAGWLAVAALALSSLPLLGYLYGASQLYSVARLTGIAFQTAAIIAVLAVGVITGVREFGFISLLESRTSGALMFRRLGVPLVLIALVVGWIRVEGQNAGLYDTAFGTAARTLVEILSLLGLLWWTARGLNRAEETLREADRRKDEFIATLSHELRNPLAPIRSAVEIMRNQRAAPSQLAASRDMIDRQVSHMARLIDDLLDVGRIARNKVKLRKEAVEMREAIRQTIESCEPQLKEKRHSLSVDLPGSPVYIDGDPVRISQILGNLLNNACKFTELNGRIAFALENSETDVTIRVSDNGVGIPANRLEGVFEMFEQVDPSNDVNRSGLGIGLSLTKQLVELHGGTITAISEGDGLGTTFIVKLPRLVGTIAAEASDVVANDGKAASQKRVLVVDDNHDAAESLRVMMTLAGNLAEIANDGQEAVERARAFQPDVVLLDIGLPILDGYGVCRAIRAEPWGNRVYIVALTGWGQDEDRRRTKEAGFDTHLVKPVDPTLILKMIASGETDRPLAGDGVQPMLATKGDSSLGETFSNSN